jgi:hypothetical protein
LHLNELFSESYHPALATSLTEVKKPPIRR